MRTALLRLVAADTRRVPVQCRQRLKGLRTVGLDREQVVGAVDVDHAALHVERRVRGVERDHPPAHVDVFEQRRRGRGLAALFKDAAARHRLAVVRRQRHGLEAGVATRRCGSRRRLLARRRPARQRHRSASGLTSAITRQNVESDGASRFPPHAGYATRRPPPAPPATAPSRSAPSPPAPNPPTAAPAPPATQRQHR